MDSNNFIKLEVSFLSNIYLIPCNGGYLQIDTAYEYDYPAYLKALEKNNIPLQTIKFLFITHHHDDHCGFINQLKDATKCKVFATPATFSFMKAGKNDASYGGGFVNSRIKFFACILKLFKRKWTLQYQPYFKQDGDIETVEGSSQMESIGINGRILFTPGHTKDHQVIALNEGSVFCGDAASSAFNMAGAKYCTAFMTNMTETYDSWRKLIVNGCKDFYPSHGPKFGKEQLLQNIDFYKDSDIKSLGFFFN